MAAMPDLERVFSKAGYGRCSPSELYRSLHSLEPVQAAIAGLPTGLPDSTAEDPHVPASVRRSLGRLAGALPGLMGFLGCLEGPAALANDHQGCLTEAKALKRL